MDTTVFGILTILGIILIVVVMLSRQFLSRLPATRPETLYPGEEREEYTRVLEEKPEIETQKTLSPEELRNLVEKLRGARAALADSLARFIDDKQHVVGEVTYTTRVGEDVISTFEDMLIWIKNAVEMVRGRFDVASTSNLILKDLFYSGEGEGEEEVEDVVANMELVEREEIERMKHHLSNVEKHGNELVERVRELKQVLATADTALSQQGGADPELVASLREEASLANSALSDPGLVDALSSLSAMKSRLSYLIRDKEKNLEIVDLVRNYIYGLRTLVGIALESLKREEFEEYLDYAWQDLAARIEAEGGTIKSSIHVLLRRGDKIILTLVTRSRSLEIENLADKRFLAALQGATV